MVNKDQIEGKWDQLKGRVREQFGKLTDNDVEEIKGNRDRFLGKLQERYGDSREQAEKRMKEFESAL